MIGPSNGLAFGGVKEEWGPKELSVLWLETPGERWCPHRIGDIGYLDHGECRVRQMSSLLHDSVFRDTGIWNPPKKSILNFVGFK